MNDWTELNEGRGDPRPATRTEVVAVILAELVAVAVVVCLIVAGQ